MIWIFLLMGVVGSVEISFHIPFKKLLSDLNIAMKETFGIVRDPEASDQRKQRFLLGLSGRLLMFSIVQFFLILTMLLPIIAMCFLGNLLGADLFDFLTTPIGITASTVSAVAYFYFRKILLYV